MAEIKDCCSCIYETRSTFTEPCVSCGAEFRNYVAKPTPKRKRKTNADRVRNMTDEELATWLNCMQSNAFHCGEYRRTNCAYPWTNDAWLNWLRQEASDG